MEFVIFKGSNMQEAVNKMLDEGFFPASLEQVWKLREDKKISFQWYDCGTVFLNGKIRRITVKELKDLSRFYDKGGRVLFLGYDRNDGFLDGHYLLNYNARFVGVKK